MEHKELMQALQARTQADAQHCSMLLTTLERVMADEAIALREVEMEGLGRFVSHKHPEYVEEDPETGEQTLCPPRISYRFQSHIVF